MAIFREARPSTFRKLELRFLNGLTEFMMSLNETHEYRYLQALGEEELGNIDKAITLYKKAIDIAPNRHKAYKAWAALEADRCNYERAIDLYRKAVDLNSDDKSSKYNLALVTELRGDLATAIGIWQDLINTANDEDKLALKHRVDDLLKAKTNGSLPVFSTCASSFYAISLIEWLRAY